MTVTQPPAPPGPPTPHGRNGAGGGSGRGGNWTATGQAGRRRPRKPGAPVQRPPQQSAAPTPVHPPVTNPGQARTGPVARAGQSFAVMVEALDAGADTVLSIAEGLPGIRPPVTTAAAIGDPATAALADRVNRALSETGGWMAGQMSSTAGQLRASAQDYRAQDTIAADQFHPTPASSPGGTTRSGAPTAGAPSPSLSSGPPSAQSPASSTVHRPAARGPAAASPAAAGRDNTPAQPPRGDKPAVVLAPGPLPHGHTPPTVAPPTTPPPTAAPPTAPAGTPAGPLSAAVGPPLGPTTHGSGTAIDRALNPDLYPDPHPRQEPK
jgi:hypothetical protein